MEGTRHTEPVIAASYHFGCAGTTPGAVEKTRAWNMGFAVGAPSAG